MTRTIPIAPPLLLVVLLLGACNSTPSRPGLPSPGAMPQEPIALINARAIDASSIEAPMREIAGDIALREFALDRALRERCAQRGIEIGREQIARERLLLGETLGLSDDQTLPVDVLEDLRAQRGLGPVRFNNLLRRNAMLRALVGSVEPSEEQIRHARRIAFGEQHRVRLFVSESPQIAGGVREAAMNADPAARPWVFAQRCADSSIHPSADRGGLIERLSPHAPGYPSAMLNALSSTPPGSCSGVLSTEAGYLVLYLEGTTPARTPSDEELDALTQQLRRDLQRQQMQRYAQELLSEQEIIVTDRSLNWAWTNRN